MIKNYSMRLRIWLSVVEIIIGTFLTVILLFGLTFFLREIGQISGSGTIHLSLNSENVTLFDIKREMANYPYDYIVFDNDINKIVGGRYVESDKSNFESGKQLAEDFVKDSVTYTYSSNKQFTLIIRQNSIPEFTNPKFRSFSYNQFTYIFFLIGEMLTITFSVYRLVREFSRNFQYIQKIALNMGELTNFSEQEKTKIVEFNQILTHLYAKSEELALLIEAERLEKKDLSFQVAALAHDVKTPLTVLKGNIELIEMTELTNQQTGFINSMKNSLAVFDTYFYSMINYTQLLNDDKAYRMKIYFSDFLIELSMELEELAITYQVNYQLDSKTNLETFHGNALALDRALKNIFVNACQFAKDGEKKVTLVIMDDEKYLYFVIWNNGQPFSDQAKKNAGKLFFTEDTGRSGKHYGIGLSFAQGVALKHQGNLVISNPEIGGVKVVIKVRK